MEIKEIRKRPNLENNNKLSRRYAQFEKLLMQLRQEDIPDQIAVAINKDIDKINIITDSERELKKQLRKSQFTILKLVEKELKLVVNNHYRNRYLGIGLALGVAVGSALGSGTGNHSWIGLGLPLGMAIGLSYGTSLDKKAKEEGKQLDVEIK